MPIIKKCFVCKKEFKTKLCLIRKRHAKYCSKKCFYKNIKGIRNSNWKGDDVGYSALHCWIKSNYGFPSKCKDCGTTSAKQYDWANISGTYKRDIKDFKRLCVKCHKKFDVHLHPKGEKHWCAKLTKKDIIKIRRLYVPYKYTSVKLAKEFNVEPCSIVRIAKKKTWKHI